MKLNPVDYLAIIPALLTLIAVIYFGINASAALQTVQQLADHLRVANKFRKSTKSEYQLAELDLKNYRVMLVLSVVALCMFSINAVFYIIIFAVLHNR